MARKGAALGALLGAWLATSHLAAVGEGQPLTGACGNTDGFVKASVGTCPAGTRLIEAGAECAAGGESLGLIDSGSGPRIMPSTAQEYQPYTYSCQNGRTILGTANVRLSNGKTEDRGYSKSDCADECSTKPACASYVWIPSQSNYCELWNRGSSSADDSGTKFCSRAPRALAPTPHGCYFKPSSGELYLRVDGVKTSTDRGRVSICRCLGACHATVACTGKPFDSCRCCHCCDGDRPSLRPVLAYPE